MTDKDTALNDLNNDGARRKYRYFCFVYEISSDQYPHTKAVPVQDAKYNFVPINANEEAATSTTRKSNKIRNKYNNKHQMYQSHKRIQLVIILIPAQVLANTHQKLLT